MPDETQQQYLSVYDADSVIEGVAIRTESTTNAQTNEIATKVDEQTQALSTKIETVGYESSNRTNEQLEDVAQRAASSALLMAAQEGEADDTTVQVVSLVPEQYESLMMAARTGNALSLMGLCMTSALVGVVLFQILTRGWHW